MKNKMEIWIQEKKNISFEIDSKNIVTSSTIKEGEWIKLDIVSSNFTEEYKRASDVTTYWDQTLEFSLSETVENRNLIFLIQHKKLTAILITGTGLFILFGWENPLEICIKENQDTYAFTYVAPQTNIAPTISSEVMKKILKKV